MNFNLTESTIDVLKNFAKINKQITLKAGKFQRTFHSSRSFLADVELDTAIPVECVIYDLNQLLGVIDIGKGEKYPDIEFGETCLIVNGSYGSATIPYADPAVVTPTPSHKFIMADHFAKFNIGSGLWSKIAKTSAILKAQSLEFEISDGSMKLNLVNEKMRDMARASFVVPNATVSPEAPNGRWLVSFDTLELMNGDYAVEFGNITATHLKSKLFGAFFVLENGPSVSYITTGVPSTVTK